VTGQQENQGLRGMTHVPLCKEVRQLETYKSNGISVICALARDAP
jgi:hypothetical protein